MSIVLPNVTPAQFPAVRWDVSDDARRWIEAIREQTDDACAAGVDATRPPRRRGSPGWKRGASSRRRVALAALLDAAVRGIGPDEVNTGP